MSLRRGPTQFIVLINLRLLIYTAGVWKASRGEVGPAVKAALAAGYRHIDGAWAYGVRTLTFPRGIYKAKHLHTERARGWRRDQGERGSSGGDFHHVKGTRPSSEI